MYVHMSLSTLLAITFSSGVPPREVVESTKCLYEQSGKDVRFLIPVIKGLTKVCL